MAPSNDQVFKQFQTCLPGHVFCLKRFPKHSVITMGSQEISCVSHVSSIFGPERWAFGVLVYEMLAGYAPFYDTDPMGTYQKILAGKVVFPPHFSRSAKDLIRKLLTSELSKRLGCLKGGVDDIKNHSWFANVNWDNVLKRRESPPIRPKTVGPSDTSNFEDYSKLEPPKDEEVILTKEEQDLFRDL